MGSKTRKPLVTLLLIFVLSLSVSIPLSASRYYGARVFHCKKYVYLKKKPSSSSKTLCKVKYGKSVDWCYGKEKTNGYYQVWYKNKKGWIKDKYCNWTGDGLDGHPSWNTTKVHRCKKYISLRKEANASSKRIAKIPKGEYVFVSVEDSDLEEDEFVYVDYRGKRGYVNSYYLKEVQ